MSQYKADKSTAIAQYNGLIKDMRESGLTLQSIGNHIGRTRERVRQILNEFYPDTQRPKTENQVACLLGSSNTALRKLRGKNILNPKHIGHCYIYDEKDIELAHQLLSKHCLICGKLFVSPRLRFCSLQCYRKRWEYRNLSPERKQQHRRLTERWRKEHLEQWKVSNQRARAKYRLKQIG